MGFYRRRKRKAEDAVAYILHTARFRAQLRASRADGLYAEQKTRKLPIKYRRRRSSAVR